MQKREAVGSEDVIFKKLNFASPLEFTFQMGDAAKEWACPGSVVSYSGRSEVAFLLDLLHLLLLHKQDSDPYSAA